MIDHVLTEVIRCALGERIVALREDASKALPWSLVFSDTIEVNLGSFTSTTKLRLAIDGTISVKSVITSCDQALLGTYSMSDLSKCLEKEYVYVARVLLYAIQCTKAARMAIEDKNSIVYQTRLVRTLDDAEEYVLRYPSLAAIASLNEFRLKYLKNDGGYVPGTLSAYIGKVELDKEYIETQDDTVVKVTVNGYNLYVGLPDLSLRSLEEA